jgi:fructose-1,6-bisphosphatase
VPTRDPKRYMLASDRGLLVLTLVETESSGLFGKSTAYSLRCAKYFINTKISHIHALSDILSVVSTSQKVILFDIFDNNILKQVTVSDVNSIRLIEDNRATQKDNAKYLLLANSKSVLFGKKDVLEFTEVFQKSQNPQAEDSVSFLGFRQDSNIVINTLQRVQTTNNDVEQSLIDVTYMLSE